MYSKMLVPLDGSELAEEALAYAVHLAGALSLDTLLFHVYDPHDYEAFPMHRAYIERTADVLRGQVEEVQRRDGNQSGGKRLEVQGELATGHPAERIIRCCIENHVDLVLMATHGRSGIRRWAMGSVADKILRASHIPVWLVRPGLPKKVLHALSPMRTVLVPLDGSELAEEVLPHVEALARQRGADQVDVILLRVCHMGPVLGYYPPLPMEWRDSAAEYRREAEEYLAGVEKRFDQAGIRARSDVLMTEPIAGSPASDIIDYAQNNRCNLIVMATHGRSGLSRWAFGSVADKVLRGVSCPVLLIRSSTATHRTEPSNHARVTAV